MATYLISGATGFIGTAVIQQLAQNNHQIIALTRDMNKAQKHFANSDITNDSLRCIESLDQLDQGQVIDGVINLAGEPIANKRWTAEQKQELSNSRLQITEALVNYCQQLKDKPKVWVNASAIGYYGNHENQVFDEQSEPQSGFTHELCKSWEQKAAQAQELGIRTCILRLGVVLGDGGALKKMLPPFKAFIGGPIGNGQQWMSWIHIKDVVNIICLMLNHDSESGIYNATAPKPVTNNEFSKTLGQVLHRPAIIRLPSFVMRLLFGEMGESLLVEGQKVIPKRLLDNGFEFKYDNLKHALLGIDL